MPPQDGDFLFRRVVRSPCRSVPASRCCLCFFMRSLHYLNGGTPSPFPAEPEHTCEFDTSPAALNELKAAEASDSVIVAMVKGCGGKEKEKEKETAGRLI